MFIFCYSIVNRTVDICKTSIQNIIELSFLSYNPDQSNYKLKTFLCYSTQWQLNISFLKKKNTQN